MNNYQRENQITSETTLEVRRSDHKKLNAKSTIWGLGAIGRCLTLIAFTIASCKVVSNSDM